MGGLAGIVSRATCTRADLTASIDTMVDALTHRGPDDTGRWVSDGQGVAFGATHRNRQGASLGDSLPARSADGRFAMLLDGWISNEQHLMTELMSLGHVIRQEARATDIVLAAIAEWGCLEAVKRFDGVCSLALWDCDTRSLYLVRDRLGARPLYYVRSGQSFYFASELRAFRQHTRIQCSIDRNALTTFLRHGFIPAPYSIYSDIHKLERGRVLVLECGRVPEGVLPQPEVSLYWSMEKLWKQGLKEPWQGAPQDAVAELERCLRQSLGSRAPQGSGTGVFLSGGIDSSTIAVLLQTQSSRPIQTFTIGLQRGGRQKAQQAAALARHIGSEHIELYIRPRDLLEVIPRLPQTWDEPFSDPSQLPFHLVCALTRSHTSISLTGDVGGVLFPGESRVQLVRRWRRQRYVPTRAREKAQEMARGRSGELLEWTGLRGRRIVRALQGLDAVDFRTFYQRHRSSSRNPTAFVPGGVELATWLTAGEYSGEVGSELRQMTFWDLVTWVPGNVLTRVDRAGMWNGVEVRVPYVDHRLIAFVSRLPARMMFRPGTDKWMLRKILNAHVDSSLVARQGLGFRFPLRTWLRHDLRAWAEGLILSRDVRAQGYLDEVTVRKRWNVCMRGHEEDFGLLWNILMFQAWLKVHHS